MGAKPLDMTIVTAGGLISALDRRAAVDTARPVHCGSWHRAIL